MTLRCIAATAVVSAAMILGAAIPPAQPRAAPEKILNQRERAELFNSWLDTRFSVLLPALMRREKIDMWVVICREHNEDPVYWSLVPQPSMFAWRLTMFVYALGDRGVECLSVNRYGSGDLHREFAAIYTPAWEPESLDPWERLARVIRERNPKKIAINESRTFAFADGLTADLKAQLVRALGPELAARLVSSERLAVGWLETRTPEELEFYSRIAALNHQLIREAFSRKAVTPGKTTIDDLSWWYRERLDELNLGTWFRPMFSIVRPGPFDPAKDRVILPGDMLRCDVGVTYMSLQADHQEIAYVLRPGESEAPKGLRQAMVLGNRLQDILIAEFREGRTGNEILASALAKAKTEGLAPRIYCHPLGYHGHGAGPRIGLPDMQNGVPGMGDYPLHLDTVHAIELGIQAKIPEWNDKEIFLPLEQDAALTAKGVAFLDGRQTEIILIRTD